jgi:serine acetyltransferase
MLLDAKLARTEPAALRRPTTTITAKGLATIHAYRLVHALRELGAADRAEVLGQLALDVRDLPPVA